MNLINPSTSRAMASLAQKLNPKDRYILSGLALKFTDLSQLPGKWQVAIKAEMAKNAVTNAKRDIPTD
jgi:hypothetical protein